MKRLVVTECPQCKGVMTNNHCPSCDVVVVGECQECKGVVLTNNDPGKDRGADWCSTDNCPYYADDFMHWEDIKELQHTCEHCGGLILEDGSCKQCSFKYKVEEEEESLDTCNICGEVVPSEYVQEGVCSYCFRVNIAGQ